MLWDKDGRKGRDIFQAFWVLNLDWQFPLPGTEEMSVLILNLSLPSPFEYLNSAAQSKSILCVDVGVWLYICAQLILLKEKEWIDG